MPGSVVAAIESGLLGLAIGIGIVLFIAGKLALLMRATPGGRKAMQGPSLFRQMLNHWRRGNGR